MPNIFLSKKEERQNKKTQARDRHVTCRIIHGDYEPGARNYN